MPAQPASSPTVVDGPADVTAARSRAGHRRRRVSDPLHPGCVRSGEVRGATARGRRPQHANALGAAAAAIACRRDARRHRRRAGGVPAGVRPPAAQNAARTAASSSTIRTTPIRVRCAPASTCSRRCAARPGWCSATWPNSARTPSQPCGGRRLRARECGVERLVRARRADARARSNPSARGARVVRGRRSADRDGCAPQLRPGVTVLVKGSRVNRLERVVEALGAEASRPRRPPGAG